MVNKGSLIQLSSGKSKPVTTRFWVCTHDLGLYIGVYLANVASSNFSGILVMCHVLRSFEDPITLLFHIAITYIHFSLSKLPCLFVNSVIQELL